MTESAYRTAAKTSSERHVREVNEQYDWGKSTFHDDLRVLLAEVDLLRSTLNFADGRSKMCGFRLADLYAADAPTQGVLERAGCWPRSDEKAPSAAPGSEAPG